MNLKEAVELALHGFLDIQECESIHYAKGRVKPLIDYLRAALAEDAMQRLADEQQMIERGTKAWAGVPDATAWLENLRGNEPVTDYHKKEVDNASPPLPTLAVHVGYRYQSPVGGWEYGNHIPAGFDTGAWAYQKIYILQEQS